jgi:hypothetical protein
MENRQQFFLVKIVVEEINNNGFYKITVVDSP